MTQRRYEVKFEAGALRSFDKLPKHIQQRVTNAGTKLQFDPRQAGSKKLVGSDRYRIRVGDYRIIYEIHDNKLLILVVELGHRKEIYR